MKTVRFFEQSGERQYARAQRIWQVLTGYVMFKQNMSEKGEGLITYADLAELLVVWPQKLERLRNAGHGRCRSADQRAQRLEGGEVETRVRLLFR